MAPSPLQQRRTHNTLLFQKLLNLRDGASPFTLVLETLEQSGGPVVREFGRRAKVYQIRQYICSIFEYRDMLLGDLLLLIPACHRSLYHVIGIDFCSLCLYVPSLAGLSNLRPGFQ